jgi:hypothetical protein
MTTAFEALVRSAESAAVAWALVHSVWLGAVAAGLVSLWRTPRARYAAGCLGLAAMLFGFGLTSWTHLPADAMAPASGEPEAAVAQSEAVGAAAIGMMTRAGAMLPWLTPFWMAGVLLFQLRAMAGWVAVGRFRRRGVCEAADWQRFRCWPAIFVP